MLICFSRENKKSRISGIFADFGNICCCHGWYYRKLGYYADFQIFFCKFRKIINFSPNILFVYLSCAIVKLLATKPIEADGHGRFPYWGKVEGLLVPLLGVSLTHCSSDLQACKLHQNYSIFTSPWPLYFFL